MLLDILPHINAIFATISSVATLVYAVISFRTLKEIKKQRQSTYRPDLTIENDYFHIYSFVKNGLGIPTEWSKEDKGHIYTSPDSVTTNPYFLKLHNIGFGTAKNIEVDFEIDMQKILENFNTQNEQIPENLRFEIIRDRLLLEIKPNSNSTPFTGSTYMNIEKGLKLKLNHVLPVSATSEFTRLRIPSLYQSLSELHLYQAWTISQSQTKEKNSISCFNFIEIPTLKLKISYRDIANEKHTKNLKIDLGFSSMSLNRFDGHFTIIEL